MAARLGRCRVLEMQELREAEEGEVMGMTKCTCGKTIEYVFNVPEKLATLQHGENPEAKKVIPMADFFGGNMFQDWCKTIHEYEMVMK